MYYGLCSDTTVAQKYNLDPEADKDFIQTIKRKQTIATVPGALGAGCLGWAYFRFMEDPKKQAL